MTPSIKKLCIFGLATGVGEMLQKQSRDGQVQWRALKLAQAGQDCIMNCKVKVDSSSFRRAKLKVDQINNDHEQFDVVEKVSFILLGGQDFRHHATDHKYIERLDMLNKRALWFMKLFDPGFESDVHEVAYQKYIAWTEE